MAAEVIGLGNYHQVSFVSLICDGVTDFVKAIYCWKIFTLERFSLESLYLKALELLS